MTETEREAIRSANPYRRQLALVTRLLRRAKKLLKKGKPATEERA